MGRALKASILATLLAAALLVFACGKHHTTGNAPLAPGNSPQSLDDAQAALDALACPDGVDAALWAQLKDALKAALTTNNQKLTTHSASSPPTGEANRVNDLAIADNGDGTYTLSWHYRNLGDYDQNGTVAVEDIIPLAQHFGETWASGEENTLPAVIDGSGNGKVGVEDITPLAANFGANVDHYAIEGAQAQDGAWEAVAEVAQDAGAGDGRLAFEHVLSDTPFRWYHAVPADTAPNSGEPSNAVFSPAFQEWVHTWGMNNNDIASSVLLDGISSEFVVGTYYNYDEDDSSIVLLQYSATGELIQQKAWGGRSYEHSALAVRDDIGNIYITGATVSFGEGGYDLILIKWSPVGNLLWQKTWGKAQYDFGSNVLVDGEGNIFVTGFTQGRSPTKYDICLLKFNPDGEIIWQKAWGRDFDSLAAAALLIEDDAIYITGYTRDSNLSSADAL